MTRFALLVVATSLAACVDTLPPLDETTSLRVELLAPTDPGTSDQRLPDTARSAQIRVTAVDAQGEIDTEFDYSTQVYAQFLGTLTPELGRAPLAIVALQDGVSTPTTVMLPPVYGPTVLWVEDGGAEGSYATGTSPILWFRDPYVADIQTPESETALDALSSSPLETKQIKVTGSRYGERGRLVVNGTYAQGYTLSDVECADAQGTPPCVAGPYDHLLIFSFQRPRDERGRNINAGQFIDGFTGGVQEFNGLTEIGFPQSFVTEADPIVVNEARIPEPVLIEESWLTNKILFERAEAGLVAMNNVTVCELDDDYATYKQWKVDIGAGCGSPINVITAGVTEFDPAARVGQPIAHLVGTLRPVNIGTFNVWIVFPRTGADLTP